MGLRSDLGERAVRRMKGNSGFRYVVRGRCGACSYVGNLASFRYVDGTVGADRFCPSCGVASQMQAAIS
jgi:hypothetical protein